MSRRAVNRCSGRQPFISMTGIHKYKIQNKTFLMVRQLEVLIHGLGHNDLAASSRVLLRQDLVTTSSSPWIRKDRCLFLFNDILLITTVSRRGTKDIKRSVSSMPSSLPAVLEMCRHKLWMYLTLSDVDICKAKEESLKKLLKEYR